MSNTCYATIDGVRITGLINGIKYQIMSNLADPGEGEEWAVTGIFAGERAPKGTDRLGYIRGTIPGAKTKNEKNGILYKVELQEKSVSPPPCQKALLFGGGRKSKRKTYTKKRVQKKKTRKA